MESLKNPAPATPCLVPRPLRTRQPGTCQFQSQGEEPGGSQGDRLELSPQARALLQASPQVPKPPKLRLGDQGPEVLRLQEDLLRWMPGWRGILAEDGCYGPQTAKALTFFKKVLGTGVDGRSLDSATEKLLDEVHSGEFWIKNPDGRPRHLRRAGQEEAYQRALANGYPLRGEEDGLSPEQVRRVAASNPNLMVRYRGFEARALTFKRFLALEKAVGQDFPGYRLAITCTTGGKHAGTAHGEGRALDLVLERIRDGYRPDTHEFDSSHLEKLARQSGFETLNEYLQGSTWWTGPHLHAEAWPMP
jgi:hypothetical protein